MLRLRKAQVTAFKDQALAEFERRVILHLRRELAEQTEAFTDEELIDRVRSATPQARKYGLETQRELMCYVDVSFLLGEAFDQSKEHPWSLEILRSSKLGSTDKARLLLATACSVYQDSRK